MHVEEPAKRWSYRVTVALYSLGAVLMLIMALGQPLDERHLERDHIRTTAHVEQSWQVRDGKTWTTDYRLDFRLSNGRPASASASAWTTNVQDQSLHHGDAVTAEYLPGQHRRWRMCTKCACGGPVC
ncbi:hypothetical protein BIV57_01090 [Mangrovactinospora gilvigrisea]|uniref:DUF3592 domain-containing protein n=1 Tax=Mangrovactinospora gilvigrisea TaxID=1428644 RepID=A0A1J7BL78_9ACTN|nr:hypothetical protein [Mangrovactinospora gilvigrisea]OIV39459.1 hypothetical protein BIV57_01090 [Mangrovactinospora gilvigrisea]